MSIPDFDIVAKELARSLGSMRFFADKSSPIEYVELLRLIPVVRHDDTVPLTVDLAPEAPELDIALVRIHTENAAPTYQLPIAWLPAPRRAPRVRCWCRPRVWWATTPWLTLKPLVHWGKSSPPPVDWLISP